MKWINVLHQGSMRFGGILLLVSSLLICVDVLLRKFADMTIGGADELAGYSLAIGTTWGLGAALADRAHVRIDTLYGLFPRWLRLACDVLGVVSFIAFFAIIAWYGYDLVNRSWQVGARSNSALYTPVFVPQLIWLLGLGVCLVTSVLLLGQSFKRIFKRDFKGASQLIGTRSVMEEMQDEVGEVVLAEARRHDIGDVVSEGGRS